MWKRVREAIGFSLSLHAWEWEATLLYIDSFRLGLWLEFFFISYNFLVPFYIKLPTLEHSPRYSPINWPCVQILGRWRRHRVLWPVRNWVTSLLARHLWRAQVVHFYASATLQSNGKVLSTNGHLKCNYCASEFFLPHLYFVHIKSRSFVQSAVHTQEPFILHMWTPKASMQSANIDWSWTNSDRSFKQYRNLFIGRNNRILRKGHVLFGSLEIIIL